MYANVCDVHKNIVNVMGLWYLQLRIYLYVYMCE